MRLERPPRDLTDPEAADDGGPGAMLPADAVQEAGRDSGGTSMGGSGGGRIAATAPPCPGMRLVWVG